MVLKEAKVTIKSLLKAMYTKKTVEPKFAEGYDISVQGRSLFAVLQFSGVPYPTRGCYFIENAKKVR